MAPVATTRATFPQDLASIKKTSALLVHHRAHLLVVAVPVVRSKSFLGQDGTVLVTRMQSDIAGLRALGQKIAGDTTVEQASADSDLISSEFRVESFVLPVVDDVIDVDQAYKVSVPSLARSIAQLKAQEAPSNRGVLAPLVSGMETQLGEATAETSGVSAQLLSCTVAQWNADHHLLDGPAEHIRAADGAVAVADRDLIRAENYLRSTRHHRGGTTTTTITSTTTTTTSTPPGSECSAVPFGTVLSREGWTASSNASYRKADAPANALDGNMASRFSTGEPQAPGLYLKVDTRSAQTFDELEMDTPNSPNDYARAYKVEVSDGGPWTVVAACSGARSPEVVSFPVQTARYIAVVLTTGASPWWSVGELYPSH
jgi:hypothetical protein